MPPKSPDPAVRRSSFAAGQPLCRASVAGSPCPPAPSFQIPSMALILLLDSLLGPASDVARALAVHGHDVVAVAEVRELMEAAATRAPGLVVLRDREMDVNGPPLLFDLRSARGAAKLPVLVLAPPQRWGRWAGTDCLMLPDRASDALLGNALQRLLAPDPVPEVASAGLRLELPDPASSLDTLPGTGGLQTEVAGYRILRLLGRGGMSFVYLARHEATGEKRVLKLLPISDHDGGDLVQRLINESALLSQVRHPCVARVYEHGFTEWHAYIAMEYLPGGDLRSMLQGPLPGDQAIEILIQLADALDTVHGAGIVHRDIKPENILRRTDGTFALVDFGIARKIGVQLSQSGRGKLLGTASYLAPERLGGALADQRSDLYSLGILFYELLVGRKPFVGDEPLKVMDMHLHAPVPRLPTRLAWAQKLLDRMLAKSPEARFQSASALVTAVLQLTSELQRREGLAVAQPA